MPPEGICQNQENQTLHDHRISGVHPVFDYPEPEHEDARGQGEGRGGAGRRPQAFGVCCKIYMLQVMAGRYFIHEHPLTATSWATDCMTQFRNCPAVPHMCAYGMHSKDKHGPGHAKKPTRFLTNSVKPAKALSRRCHENHRHVLLMEGRARAAAIYPQSFCRTIFRATFEQAKADAGDLFVHCECVNGDGDEYVNEVALWEP